MNERGLTQKTPAPALQSVQSGLLQRKCACGNHTIAGGECAECRKKREGMLQRSAASAASMNGVPPIVHEVLRSSGQPLDPATRAFMEPHFGYDFSRVRVHTDAKAVESAQAVNALAYTVGRNVVFGAGQYAPEASEGRRLLAHELTHVVQQQASSGIQPKSAIDAPGSSAEHEANIVAERVASGKVVMVQQRAITTVLQRQPCRPFLNQPEVPGGRVSGIAAHTAISEDFVTQVGGSARRLTVPAASFGPYRTDTCYDDPHPQMISPVTYGGRAGDGIPDLVYQSGGSAELAEIKPADISCFIDAERQVNNYVEKGDDRVYPVYAQWRRSQGINSLRLMPTSRFSPTSPLPVAGKHISVMWCGPGIVVYKAVEHPDVFLCRSLSDKGAADRFLESVVGRAQGQVDRYIDTVVEPAITNAIQRMTVRQAIVMLYRYGRDVLRDFVTRQAGGGAAGRAITEGLLGGLPDEVVVDRIAQWIDQQIGERAERNLKDLAQLAKSTLLFRARQWLQTNLRRLLQESLNALCAGAFSVSIVMLLRKLWQDMARYFGRAVVEVIEEVARELVMAFLRPLAVVVLAVAAVVLVVALIITIIDLVPGDEVAVGAALAAVVRLLQQLIQSPAFAP